MAVPRNVGARYAAAIAVSIAAVALTALGAGVFGGPYFVVGLSCVVVLALVAGAGPGLVATVLVTAGITAVAAEPLDAELRRRLIAFFVTACLLTALIGSMRRSRELTRHIDEIRDGERHLRSLFGESAFGTAQLDQRGRFAFVNARFSEITGYTAEELSEMVLADLAPAETRERELEETRALLTGGRRIYEHEKPWVRKDGQIVWVHGAAIMMCASDGSPLRASIVAIDITGRKRTEIEHARAIDVLEHGEPCFVLDSQFRFVLANQRHEQIVQKKRSEMLGRTFWEVFPAAAVPEGKYWRELHQVMRERVVSEFVEYYPPREMWTEVRVYPTSDGGIAVFFHDATPRKHAELERERLVTDLRQSVGEATRSRAQLEAVFQAIDDGVMIFDMGGDALLVNEAAARDFGFDAAASLMRDLAYFAELFELTTPEGNPVPFEQWPVSRVLRGESVQNAELRTRRRDTGTAKFFSYGGQPVFDDEGRPSLAVLVMRDISDRRRADEERESLLVALEERDRRKDEFIGMLSHELRNPLAPIRNAVYVLEHAPRGGPASVRAFRVLERQVEHLTRLIEDLLDVTRISRGKVELHRETLDLAAVVRRAVDDHRDGFGTSGVHLVVSAPDDPVFVEGDATRLTQIVGNLLQNAGKFTPRGGSTTVTVEREVESAVVRVRDTGAGITAQTLAHLFEPFEQGDKTLDRSRGGLGLGLALVKGLVELHGGNVSASSPGPGRGAEVVVRLPLAPAPSRATSQEVSVRAKTDGRRVLVIEDNIDAAETLKEALELENNVVELAFAGPEGVEKARAFAPDVVVCDLGLPGLDGYGVARAIRSDPSLASTYLVALSGYARQQDVDRAHEAGFDRHVAKPPELRALRRMISEAPARA